MTIFARNLSMMSTIFLVAALCRAQQSTLSPREQLQQYVMQLQAHPSDDALRQKIIALALTLDPNPAVPDEAVKHEGAAEYAFKNARSNADLTDAAGEYEKALLAAPWVAADYFNSGVAYEKAGEFKQAIRAFNLYLLASPNSADAVDVKKRIGALQYASDKATSAEQQQQLAAVEAEQQREAAKQLEGRYSTHTHREGRNSRGQRWWHDEDQFLTVTNGQVIFELVVTADDDASNVGTRQQQWTAPLVGRQFRYADGDRSIDGTVTADGSSITLTITPAPAYHDPNTYTNVFRHQ